MKITYLNEAFRLPIGKNKSQNKVSLEDIHRANANYMEAMKALKKKIISNIQNEFIMASRTDPYVFEHVLSQYCLHYYGSKFDFTPGIRVVDSLNDKPIVYLYVEDCLRTEYFAKFNDFLNNIQAKYSDLISDIRLQTIGIDYRFGVFVSGSIIKRGKIKARNIEKYIVHVPFPYKAMSYTASDDTVTPRTPYPVKLYPKPIKEIINSFTIEMLPYITTKEYWKGAVEFAARYDDVAEEGVYCALQMKKFDTLSNINNALKIAINDSFPKFNFKFSNIYIWIVDPCIEMINLTTNIWLDIFNLQNVLKIAYDFDKFYVTLEWTNVEKSLATSVKCFLRCCTPERIAVAAKIFYYMYTICFTSCMGVNNGNTNGFSFGYYPKRYEFGFMTIEPVTDSIYPLSEYSPGGEMTSFVSLDEIIDRVINDVNDISAITENEMKNEIIKIFNITSEEVKDYIFIKRIK